MPGMFRSLLAVVFVFALVGCDSGRRAKLEKENQELKADAAKNRAVADYDLQARCSNDAKAWFNENFRHKESVKLLNQTNHYNKSLNKCFALVELHFSVDATSAWINDIGLWDVYENSQLGDYAVHHKVLNLKDGVQTCEVANKKCTTMSGFENLVRPYLSN
jgi:hypothetical protein